MCWTCDVWKDRGADSYDASWSTQGSPSCQEGSTIFELMSYRENEQYGEKSYMAVYQDVCENEDEWMEVCSCIALYLYISTGSALLH